MLTKEETKFKDTEIGLIPEEWNLKKLTDIGELARGKSKHRPRDAKHLYGGPYPFIQTGDIKNSNHRIYNHSQTYSEAGLAQSRLWDIGTICITIAANIAETGILTFPACFPDSVIGFVANQDECLVDFVEYLLQHYKQSVRSHIVGSVQDNINLGTFENLRFAIPPLKEQKVITEILSSLDEKIELNRRMNKTLEEIGKALFKRWFVDFEFPNEDGKPYKSSGGKMLDSELGEIPELATTFILSQNIDTISGDWGKDHSSGKFTEEVLCIRGTDLPELAMGNYGKPPTRFIKPNPEKILQIGDIIIEISGGSTNQSTGRVLLITKQLLQRYNAPLICSNFCKILRPKKSLLSSIFYTYLSFLYNNDHFFQYENGTTGIKNLNLDIFLESTYLVIPSEKELLNLANLLEFYESIIQKNGQECFFLRSIRDSLLPKLISGRIRTTK